MPGNFSLKTTRNDTDHYVRCSPINKTIAPGPISEQSLTRRKQMSGNFDRKHPKAIPSETRSPREYRPPNDPDN
ncbi:hypothetical protein GWI33_023302 [Rhynchophorus ferrugineus]|uniref:Uncharacterized protein n=1 Tax=Rhynchophorus ferrugineus TaxID=354439 RepID=A0A834HMK0_RHYFE|nr:hypothetical protein GWI33_023302 [Rhynchophorus ferrugineus]